MPITIRVRNYQSIEDATVVVDGFTVVTGQNNTGKSAFQRAVRAAFQNAKGSSFIRHGADKCIVNIDFGDGHTLQWEKGRTSKDKPKYIIDGGEPIFPGQGVPDEVLNLGIHPIEIGKDSVWPQFAPQFKGQLFLIDQPGSVLAEAVSDVDRVSQLNQALRLAESDKRNSAAKMKVRLVDEETQTKDVAKFKGLDQVVSDMQSLEVQEKQLARIEKALTGMKDLRDRVRRHQKVVLDLSGVDKIEVPDDLVLEATLKELKALEPLQVQRNRQQRIVLDLSGVDQIDVPEVDLGPTLKELEVLENLRGRRNRYQRIVSDASWVDSVSVPSEGDLGSILKDLEALTGIRNRYEVSFQQKKRWNDLLDSADIGSLGNEAVDKCLQALEKFEGLRSTWIAVVQKVAGATNEVDKAEKEAAAADEELRQLLDGLEECPLCGSAIDHTH